ncbi:hypothetical protein H4S02_002894 [Coemansia sp. RSA 2611]|nr:hypothetical protein H4S02_002894 [Coemansia sp. RSA 2611]
MSQPMEKLTAMLDDGITDTEKSELRQKIKNQGGTITNESELINAFFVTMPKSQGFAGLKSLHSKIKDVEQDQQISAPKPAQADK